MVARQAETATVAALAARPRAGGAGYLVAHRLIWGGWTVYASGDHFQRSGEFGVVGFDPDYVGRGLRLVGLLVDRGFGLVPWQPAWLLVVPAVAALIGAPWPAVAARVPCVALLCRLAGGHLRRAHHARLVVAGPPARRGAAARAARDRCGGSAVPARSARIALGLGLPAGSRTPCCSPTGTRAGSPGWSGSSGSRSGLPALGRCCRTTAATSGCCTWPAWRRAAGRPADARLAARGDGKGDHAHRTGPPDNRTRRFPDENPHAHPCTLDGPAPAAAAALVALVKFALAGCAGGGDGGRQRIGLGIRIGLRHEYPAPGPAEAGRHADRFPHHAARRLRGCARGRDPLRVRPAASTAPTSPAGVARSRRRARLRRGGAGHPPDCRRADRRGPAAGVRGDLDRRGRRAHLDDLLDAQARAASGASSTRASTRRCTGAHRVGGRARRVLRGAARGLEAALFLIAAATAEDGREVLVGG